MALIKKFLYGGPGYFMDRLTVDGLKLTGRKISRGIAKGGLSILGWLGNAFNTLITSGASTDYGQTSPFVNMDRTRVANAREATRLKAKQTVERAIPYISPSNHIVSWFNGSFNPMVGALKMALASPEALLLGAVFDMLTFTKGKPAITKVSKGTVSAVDRGLAATGSKEAKGRVIAREINKAIDLGMQPQLPVFTGVSRLETPSNEFTRYSREPVIMGDKWGAWEVDYPDYVKHRVDKIKLQVESSHGKVKGHDYDAMPGSIILQHVQKQGFHPYYVLYPGANLRGQLAETIRRLDNIAGRDWVRNKQVLLDGTAPYYLGYFDEAGIAGSHNMKNGINLIELNPYSKMHLDMMHEGISHGTDSHMPLTVIDNYQSFVDKVMNHPDINPDKTTYRYKGWSESIPSGTDKWYELRATMNEIRKDMYDRIAKDKGVKVNESTMESLRPEFERLVDAITLDLAAETLRKANSYGRVYGTLGPTINPSFLGEFKGLLKIAPAVTAPLIFKYNE